MSEQPSEEHPDSPFPVVALGGSAGALEALQAFVAHLPADTGAAYVIVTHYPSGQRSLLPDLLATQTQLPVQTARSGEPLAPDRIYVALPNDGWVVRPGPVLASKPGEADGSAPQDAEDGALTPGRERAIDLLFRSLAEEAGPGAVAIVLSGTGSDGTTGAKRIKAHGGMLMAQEPSTCEFSDMPCSAIATGQVDHVLPPRDMPGRLVSYLSSLGPRLAAPTSSQAPLPRTLLEQILEVVHRRTGHDFSCYRQSTLQRRLERRMDLVQIPDPQRYLDYLARHPGEVDLLFKDILISVTTFFRDPVAWGRLAHAPLPEMLRRAGEAGRDFRAWVVGCATGEEAYTLAMLIHECLPTVHPRPQVRIFASDLDPGAIETARTGRYSGGIAEDVSEQRLRHHFVAETDAYRVSRELRDMVVFAEHNALQDPPFTHMDLVTCRNLLIYLERRCQDHVLSLLRYALRDQGVLFLGPSESPEEHSEIFRVLDKEARLYRCTGTAPLPTSLRGLSGPGYQRRPQAAQHALATSPSGGEEHLARSAERLLAERFAPAAVLVNDHGEVTYIHGRTGRFLEPASGTPRSHLLDMARPGLQGPLGQALREVGSGASELARRDAHVETNGHSEWVRVEVQRVRTPEALEGLRLVTFSAGRSAGAAAPNGPPAIAPEAESGPEAGDEAAQLRRRLETALQDKQMAIRELKASNEELQSMNEELHSMNEELQSSNEELEVAKEEGESLNQELRSVNAELQARIQELTDTNDDLRNLLDNTQLPTLFLDEHLQIKRFNTALQDLVPLREADLGRPLKDLSTRLRDDALNSGADRVLRDLVPRDVTVQSEAGHWYLLRIRPYRGTGNTIRGVVCIFQDAHTGMHATERGEPFLREVLDTLREPVLLLDPQMQILGANDGFYRTFRLPPDEVEGRSLLELHGGQWDHPELRAMLAEVLPRNRSFRDLELRLSHEGPGPQRLTLNGRRLEMPEAHEGGVILLAMSCGDRDERSGS